ncbi:GGDEF domain-containing protein [Crossiella sp. SN42]|uniref:GGDEF domain-containing protein n=1 Tax=Crossiella sp. SN42 TaxID=2944808 RepID=UPI00207D0376|nr:diguanylate cyclase [Crossiella sp. SN42]MCO1575573.1 GGDEF domain-containing protein [Crossiella sp. SN42]
MDLTAVALVALMWATGSGLSGDALVGLVLAMCAVAHARLGRIAEERRRATHLDRHVDLVEIWWVAAAMLVPEWAVLVVLVVRLQRYHIARRSLYKFLFSTASILIAATGVGFLARFGGVPHYANGDRPVDWMLTLTMVGCAALAIFAQQLIVAGVVALTQDAPRRAELWGSSQENAAEATAVLLSLFVVGLGPHLPELWLGVFVIGTRLGQHRALQAEADTDLLTGLANRRAWLERAGRAHGRAHGRSALLMLDLDHFKQVNDTYGHVVGDDVLRAVASELAACMRAGDVLGRWGGEEFIVLLPASDARDAMAVAERIRAAVETLTVPTTQRRGGAILLIDGLSLSAGVAVAIDCERVPVLQELADQALYRAKAAGRNRVVLADSAETAATRRVTDH